VQQKAFRWGIWHPSVMQFYSGPLIHFLSGVDKFRSEESKFGFRDRERTNPPVLCGSRPFKLTAQAKRSDSSP
jgi:hypothetical protein